MEWAWEARKAFPHSQPRVRAGAGLGKPLGRCSRVTEGVAQKAGAAAERRRVTVEQVNGRRRSV